MGSVGMPEIVVIGLIILVLFGAKNLPGIGKAAGRAIAEFRKAVSDPGSGIEDRGNKE